MRERYGEAFSDSPVVAGLCVDGGVNPGSVLVGWFSLHYVGRVEQANTQALLPTMNMARQLSEAGAYELFSAQSLSSADSEREWLAQVDGC